MSSISEMGGDACKPSSKQTNTGKLSMLSHFPLGHASSMNQAHGRHPPSKSKCKQACAQCMVPSRHRQVASVIDRLRPLSRCLAKTPPSSCLLRTQAWGRHSKPTFSGLTSQFPGAATVPIHDGPSIHGGWHPVLTSSAFSFLETEPVISEHLTLENSLLWWCHGNKNRLSPICTKQGRGAFDEHIETRP